MKKQPVKFLTLAVVATLAFAGSANAESRMYTPVQNNAIAEKFFETAWNKGDFDSVKNLLSPNVVDHSPVPGQESGPEKFREIVGMFRAAMPDVKMTIQDEIYAGDKVVHRWMISGTQRNALMGIPATNKPITLTGVSMVRMENGQIVERWTQLDELGLMRQLGVVPPEPGAKPIPSAMGQTAMKPTKKAKPNRNMMQIPAVSNNAIAEKFFETAWNKGDFDSVAGLLSPAVVDHSLVPGQTEGAEKFRQIVGMFRAAMPDVKMSIQDEVYSGDKVVHRWLVTGTNTGASLFGVPTTNKPLTLSGITIVRMENGQIVERWTQLDQLGLLQQLGVVPKPKTAALAPAKRTPKLAQSGYFSAHLVNFSLLSPLAQPLLTH